MYSIKKLGGATRANPQSAYALSTKPEWQYLQRTTPNLESCFHLLETATQEEFLPALFGEGIDDSDYCTPSSEIFWTGFIKHSQFRNAESPI